jgi:hypothetical protein
MCHSRAGVRQARWISVDSNELAPGRIRRRDAEGLLDLAVMVEAVLMEDTANSRWTRKLAGRLAHTGLVARGASQGELAATVNDLNSAVRYLLGDGGEGLPEPMGHVGIHMLLMPWREAALSVRARVVGAGLTAIVRAGWGDNWEVDVSGPELPPDPDFQARAGQLETLAAELGGRYAGSGRR